MLSRQTTLETTIATKGIGLHSGNLVNMAIKPAPCNSGIQFCRTDLPGHPIIEAKWNNVVDTTLATTIGYNGYRVSTIEHLMAAFNGLGIDNARVELNNAEVPIMDGSAGVFVQMIKKAGIIEQKEYTRFAVINKPLKVKDGDKSISVYPSDSFKITYEIDFKHPAISSQNLVWEYDQQSFSREICNARTFGFLEMIEQLQAHGLAKGGSLDNAIVLDDKGVINKEGLRFKDEFVRHKMLDFIGDIFLLGTKIMAHFHVVKAGHDLNNKFLSRLNNKLHGWEIIQYNSQKNSKYVLPTNRLAHLPVAAMA